ncbi:MAG: DUF1232 domain-containing protein [Chthoniobacter sp.]|nr:DUF1232 domain-containing protein [Chthoniobacter sp.]
MTTPDPTPASYLNYAARQGINLRQFVTQGGRLLGPKDHTQLTTGISSLREKICVLRDTHPRLGRQLDFLLNFIAHDNARPWETVGTLPEAVRNETVFALLYTVKDLDLIPDDTPGIGFLDDAAVIEIVLTRHAAIFEQYCATHDLDWVELRPGLPS